MKIDFCLPIYNEELILQESIESLFNFCVRQSFAFEWKIIIINNGSTDNSKKICNKLHNEKIKIIEVVGNGKGLALKKYISQSQADIAFYMDIDLSASIKHIIDLINIIITDGYDLAIGSRMLPGSKTNRSAIRNLNSRCYNLLARSIFRHSVSDLQCGFKAIRAQVFKEILPYIKDDKWFFDTELIIFAEIFNYKIKDFAVEWEEKRYQKRKSKVNLLKDGFVFFFKMINLKTRILKIGKYHCCDNKLLAKR
jgi:glycosyltransferase involved in cell wall biosynthesis